MSKTVRALALAALLTVPVLASATAHPQAVAAKDRVVSAPCMACAS
ncbi:hypothetical protein [Catenulispora subtropica]|uniref:Uncharacterized protein n=1 Tax=Catenulispora subtropica TaxID=450798 RepID=A0ABN2RMB5_9ACTN